MIEELQLNESYKYVNKFIEEVILSYAMVNIQIRDYTYSFGKRQKYMMNIIKCKFIIDLKSREYDKLLITPPIADTKKFRVIYDENKYIVIETYVEVYYIDMGELKAEPPI